MPEAQPATTAAPQRASRYGAAFAGLGSALPQTVIPNAPIAEHLGVDDHWITSRTGITERRHLQPDEKLADLAGEAAHAILADAGMDVADVDLILVATASPDDVIPNLAPAVAGRLGSRTAAIDVGCACAGFIAGIDLATAHLEAGRADNVLVLGAERLSQFTNRDDKRTAALFGDASAGVVLTRVEADSEVGPVILRSDDQRDLLYADRRRCLIEMEGYEVFQFAVNNMSQVTLDVLERDGLTLDDVDLFVYHQANARIIRSVGQRLQLPVEKVVDCIQTYGNVSAASIPLGLLRAREEGRLFDGAKVLLSGFGAGFVWGATTIDWRGTHA